MSFTPQRHCIELIVLLVAILFMFSTGFLKKECKFNYRLAINMLSTSATAKHVFDSVVFETFHLELEVEQICLLHTLHLLVEVYYFHSVLRLF